MAKQVCFDQEAREALRNGVIKLARAVKSTLGPRGRCAVIDRGWGSPTITKDGYTVADEVELKDPVENMGAQLLKQASSKTHDVAGDGTTTATVLAESLFVNALRHVASGANTIDLIRGMQSAAEEVVERLRKEARKVTLDDQDRILQVASIAANGDDRIAKILVDALKRVGGDGVISVEEGKGTDTEIKVVEGMQFDRGYLSPHFMTDQKTLECDYRDCFVLIHEEKLSSVKPLVPLLEKLSKAGKPLLVIAEDVDGEALATLVVNKLRGVVNCVAVKAPGYGERRKAMLQDIAILTGAKKPAFKELAVDLESLAIADLGRAKHITVTADTTTIVEGAGSAADLSGRIKQIRHEIEDTDSTYDREKLQERLAKLTGGVAQINVGASTETEMKEIKARIKDAKNSVAAALEGGILPGGGTALLRVAGTIDINDQKRFAGDRAIGAQVLVESLRAPFEQIIDNAGGHGPVSAEKVLKNKSRTFGYNVTTDTYADLFDEGIIDPCNVTISALQNAVSVAAVLISTDCVVTDAKQERDDEELED